MKFLIWKSAYLSLAQSRRFYRTQKWIKSTQLDVKSKIFGVRYAYEDTKTNYGTLREVVQHTQKSIILALTAAIALQVVDQRISSFYPLLGLSVPEDGDYVSFFATISGIGGVFIGLYYAAISTVGSSIYATVPDDVRSLLARERFGDVYMRLLAFLTFFCLIMVSMRLTGMPRNYLAVVLASVGGGVGIFAFVALGQRVFYFFDPTKLALTVFKELNGWISKVEEGGNDWSDTNFQAHAQRNAARCISTIEALADTAIKQSHLSGDSLTELVRQSTSFLISYCERKPKIPTTSLWFEQKYRHYDWYATDDSRVSIAHQSSTQIQPEVVLDHFWFERRVEKVLLLSVRVSFEKKRYTHALKAIDCIDLYLNRLSQTGEVVRCHELLKALEDDIAAVLFKEPDSIVESIETIAVFERLSSLLVSVSLGFRKSVVATKASASEDFLNKINWLSSTDIYRHDVPHYGLHRVEWIKKRLTFEIEADGRQISPPWYISEIYSLEEALRFQENVSQLVDCESVHFHTLSKICDDAQKYWLAAAILSGENEYWAKLQYQVVLWAGAWEALTGDSRIKGLPWPKVSIDETNRTLRARQIDLISRMAQRMSLLYLTKKPEDCPDYPGQFLHTAGEYTFDSLIRNDVSFLETAFQNYLIGCFLMFEELAPDGDLTDWRVQQRYKVAAAALLDLLDISGYAKLLADFHNNNRLWEIVEERWLTYLKSVPRIRLLTLLSGAVAITESGFEISHRSILRTAWKQSVDGLLRQLPRVDIARNRLGDDSVADHKSSLVRRFANDRHGAFDDGLDVFIEFFVRKNGGEELDFGRRRRSLREALDREESVWKEIHSRREAE
ncbi:hypothetical protein R0137_09725 [Congregibacter brevis]|uniref:Uncharacterized protein n=1 Tax=Congregibacter brevis TaxID=3081201 RepID=A0ABZ0I7N7_9GAMM|nr:hypothetical protein R0137_09725 [Congregibacter sp. IMCC45268]